MKILELQKQVDNIKDENFEISNIVFISNVVLEPYLEPCLKMMFAGDEYNIFLKQVLYDDYKSELNDIIFDNCNMFVVFLNFDVLVDDIINIIARGEKNSLQVIEEMYSLCEALYCYLKQNYETTIVWFGFEDYYCQYKNVVGHVSLSGWLVDKINIKLAEMIATEDVLVDTKEMIAEIGINNAYDINSKYRWNAPYSKIFVEEVASEIKKQHKIVNNVTPKCIILDCDNVLWGGILSEDGFGGIHLGRNGLGRPYYDFQRFILTLYYHGVILAVCSKNDLSDVKKVFNEHNEMILKEEYISCFKVNWDNKTENIKEISSDLNIGLSSIVFVDDSLFEIEAVKKFLPEVIAILYDRDSIYNELRCFSLKKDINLQQIQERVTTYTTDLQRKKLRAQHDDFELYLAALEMNIDIHLAKEIEFNRIAELSQRTNKRTIGMRYTLSQIKEKTKKESYKLYSVFVTDKFSNLGLIGALGIDGRVLDLFCVSCRALGRGVEDKMIKVLHEYEIDDMLFKSTEKNEDLKLIIQTVIKK